MKVMVKVMVKVKVRVSVRMRVWTRNRVRAQFVEVGYVTALGPISAKHS